MGQARRDVDEVALADLDYLGAPRPELDCYLSAGDVGVGGVVPVVVPAGRGATGKDGEAGPDPVMGEGLASLHAGALLGRRVLQLLLGDDLWAVHGLLPVSADDHHRSMRLPAWPHNPKSMRRLDDQPTIWPEGFDLSRRLRIYGYSPAGVNR